MVASHCSTQTLEQQPSPLQGPSGRRISSLSLVSRMLQEDGPRSVCPFLSRAHTLVLYSFCWLVCDFFLFLVFFFLHFFLLCICVCIHACSCRAHGGQDNLQRSAFSCHPVGSGLGCHVWWRAPFPAKLSPWSSLISYLCHPRPLTPAT